MSRWSLFFSLFLSFIFNKAFLGCFHKILEIPRHTDGRRGELDVEGGRGFDAQNGRVREASFFYPSCEKRVFGVL